MYIFNFQTFKIKINNYFILFFLYKLKKKKKERK